jgi:hypothetical protein
MNAIVLCSAFKKIKKTEKDGVKSEQPLYLNSTTTGINFFSNEKLSCGQAVKLTPKKKGDTYIKADGTTGTITADYHAFDGIIGVANNISEIKSTVAAFKEAGLDLAV